jgi:hypothetical protein
MRLRAVLRHPLASDVQEAEIILGEGIPCSAALRNQRTVSA